MGVRNIRNIIKALDICAQCADCTECQYYETRSCKDVLHNEAISLMNRMEEVTPIHTPYRWTCGACNGVIHRKDTYCRDCGRKIKWE